jgi:hypothetical protein
MKGTLLVFRVMGGGPLLVEEAYLCGVGLLVLDVSIRHFCKGPRQLSLQFDDLRGLWSPAIGAVLGVLPLGALPGALPPPSPVGLACSLVALETGGGSL